MAPRRRGSAGPVSAAFTRSVRGDGLGALAAEFSARGFIILPRLLTARAADAGVRRCDAMLGRRDGSVPAEWLLGTHQRNQLEPQAWISDIALHPDLMTLIRALLGGERPALLSTQVFVKEPSASAAEVPWHQDGPSGGNSIAVWLALDAIAADGSNGGLQVLPWPHARGRLPADAGAGAASTAYDRIDDAGLAPHLPGVTYALRPGGAGVHGPWTPHRSGPNTSRRRRRVLVLRYASAAKLAARGEPLWLMRGGADEVEAGSEDGGAHQIPRWTDGALIDRRAYVL